MSRTCSEGRAQIGEGALVVSIARTYTLDQIQKATELSRSRRPDGKLMLVL